MIDRRERVESAKPRPEDPGDLPRVSRFQVAVLALMVAAGAAVYSSLPARIPLHWGIGGQVDRWGTKSFMNVFFPALIVVAMMVLYWALPRLDPFKRSYTRFSRSYALIIDLIVAFMALLFAITLYASFHPAVQVGTIVAVGVGLLLAAVGNQMSKVKRNFFIGIRTPWTLASNKVWVRTHRIGARMFVVGGLVAASAAFLPPPLSFYVFIVVTLGITVGVYAVSYLIYRDLEKRGELDGPGEQTLGQPVS